MPNMDGIEATTYLRAHPPPNGPRPVIVSVTASDSVHQARRARDAGVDDQMLKPVRKDALQRMLERLVASGLVERGGSSPSACGLSDGPGVAVMRLDGVGSDPVRTHRASPRRRAGRGSGARRRQQGGPAGVSRSGGALDTGAQGGSAGAGAGAGVGEGAGIGDGTAGVSGGPERQPSGSTGRKHV